MAEESGTSQELGDSSAVDPKSPEGKRTKENMKDNAKDEPPSKKHKQSSSSTEESEADDVAQPSSSTQGEDAEKPSEASSEEKEKVEEKLSEQKEKNAKPPNRYVTIIDLLRKSAETLCRALQRYFPPSEEKTSPK